MPVKISSKKLAKMLAKTAPPSMKATKVPKVKRPHAAIKPTPIIEEEPTTSLLPHIVVKEEPLPEEILRWMSTTPGFIEATTATDDEPTNLYDYQVLYMNSSEDFRNVIKARQVGFSYTFAAEGVAMGQLSKGRYTGIYVSYNQEEATEKIYYAKMLYESIPAKWRRKIVVDNKHSIEFEDSTGAYRTRLLSHAQREVRGKGGNASVYLDELAHYIMADRIYSSSLPVIMRGNGRLITASTPNGQGNLFHKICTDKRKYDMFIHFEVPWWICPEFCSNVTMAKFRAHKMTTEQRVRTYGTKKLKHVFKAMMLDDFQQEYEMGFIDENLAYFPYSMLGRCAYHNEYDNPYDPDEDGDGGDDTFPIMEMYPDVNFKRYETVDALKKAVSAGEVGQYLLMGYDVGRKRDTSELTIIEEIERGDKTLQVVRLMKQFDRDKFQYQKEVLRRCMDVLPIRRGAIDATGIGANLAEDLSDEYPDKIDEVDFTMQWKEIAATNLRIRFEAMALAIPDDPQLLKQLNMIKRAVTSSGNTTFNVERNREHHGDKAWSLALASNLGRSPVGYQSVDLGGILKINCGDKSIKRIITAQPMPLNIPVFNLPVIVSDGELPALDFNMDRFMP